MAEPERRKVGRPRRAISDQETLNALISPVRVAILDHLIAFGPQTAAQCARAVNETASNCSYHLRSLARYGLVERVQSADGRERPWKPVETSLDIGAGVAGGPVEPGVESATRVLAEQQVVTSADLALRAIRERDVVDEQWRDAMLISTYPLRATAAELAEITQRLDDVLRPYRTTVRQDAPDDAAVIAVMVNAFKHPLADPGA